MRVTPLVNEKPLNLEKTTSRGLSVLLLNYHETDEAKDSVIIKCKKVSSLKNKDKGMQSSKLLLDGKLSSEPNTFVTLDIIDLTLPTVILPGYICCIKTTQKLCKKQCV